MPTSDPRIAYNPIDDTYNPIDATYGPDPIGTLLSLLSAQGERINALEASITDHIAVFLLDMERLYNSVEEFHAATNQRLRRIANHIYNQERAIQRLDRVTQGGS